jgi:hypothetical protein
MVLLQLARVSPSTTTSGGRLGLFVGALVGTVSGAAVMLLGAVNGFGSYQVSTGASATFSAVSAAWWQGTRMWWDEEVEGWAGTQTTPEIRNTSRL